MTRYRYITTPKSGAPRCVPYLAALISCSALPDPSSQIPIPRSVSSMPRLLDSTPLPSQGDLRGHGSATLAFARVFRRLREFESVWPLGSAAHVSYHDRIVHGPEFTIDQAARGSMELYATTMATTIAAMPSNGSSRVSLIDETAETAEAAAPSTAAAHRALAS